MTDADGWADTWVFDAVNAAVGNGDCSLADRMTAAADEAQVRLVCMRLVGFLAAALDHIAETRGADVSELALAMLDPEGDE